MFAGLLKVGFLGAAVAFNGEARLRRAKTQDVLDVVGIQGGVTTAKVPSDEFDWKSAAQNDSGSFRVAPNVVLGGGCHVSFATRSAAHNHAAADFRGNAGI